MMPLVKFLFSTFKFITMSKTKTKAGELVSKILHVLEGQGKYALMISIEDGKIKIRRFSPGKDLQDVTEVTEDQVLLMDGSHVQGLLHPTGSSLEAVQSIIHEKSDLEKLEVKDEN